MTLARTAEIVRGVNLNATLSPLYVPWYVSLPWEKVDEMDDALRELFSEVVKERFPDAVIDDITVVADEDSDGDPILRVTIVFDSEIADIEARSVASLTRHARPKLREHNDNRFPIFRFLSKRDNDRLAHAAA
jgi:hypothetical protein